MPTISLKNPIKFGDSKFFNLKRFITFIWVMPFIALSGSIFAISFASMPYSPIITIIAGLFLCIACVATLDWWCEIATDLERWHHHLRKSKFRTINLVLCSAFLGYLLVLITGYMVTASMSDNNISYLMLFLVVAVTYPRVFLRNGITGRNFIRLNRFIVNKRL